MSRRIFYAFLLGLVVVGLLTAWLRHVETGMPFLPGEQKQVWVVEARVDFTAENGPVLLSLNLPEDPPGFRVLMEQTASPGYGFSIVEHDGHRRGEWSVRRASGRETLYYKIQVVPDRSIQEAAGRVEPSTEQAVFWTEPEATAAEQLLESVRARSSTPESLTRELIRELNAPAPSQHAALLLGGHSRINLLKQLLMQAQIPVRVSRGLVLEDARRNQSLTSFIEIHTGGRWLLFDPVTGIQGLSDNMLIWQRGARSLVDLMGGSGAQVSFSMIRQTVPARELAETHMDDGLFGLLSIYRLPIEEQSVFKLLMVLPIGALITVFMRIMVGLRTSGTFMPMLIALAFLQTSLLPGLLSFISIVGIGLLLRGYLSRLNLLLVARIATIIVIVIFIIAAMSLIGYRLGFNTGMTLTFFPIIIIAWTIERMSILWEEEGPWEVLIQGGGSLIVAILAFLFMQASLVGHLSFNFPELNLVVIALLLLMGQYTGYRLLELRRFREFNLEEKR